MVLKTKNGTKETLGQMLERIRQENEALRRLINALQADTSDKKSQKQNQ